MPAAGPRLRTEREKRGLRLVDVAMATKVGAHHLSALEYEDFDALPDERSVIGFVRLYAEHIGLDPEDAAAEYARALEAARPAGSAGTETRPEEEAKPEERAEAADETAREESLPLVEEAGPPTPREPSPVRRWLRIVLPAAALTAALALLGWWWVSGEEAEGPPSPLPEPVAAGPAEIAGEEAGTGVTPASADRAAAESRTEGGESLGAEDNSAAAGLIVREHGVGTGVVDRGLVGESSRFTEGERVWFWTRVSGGVAGETIRHVWFHEGREVARIPLTLGGPHWRTQSRKILTPGMTGDWAVEARDDSGRLLARSRFVCEAH